MIKEIKYNGYSANPSDYECADGDLATSIGVIPENGALKPILPPSEVLQFKGGDSVMYIHKSANFKHYIIFNNNSISWWNGSDAHQPVFLRSFNEVYQVTAIGNTLLILSTDGMHYFLWKGNNDGYLYLGTKIPECPLSFGLQGEMVRQMNFQYHLMLLVKAAFGMNSLITIKRELQTKYLPISINLLLKGLQIRANSFFLSL